MKAPWARAFRQLQASLGPGEFSTERAVCERYAADKWFASHVPDAVARPASRESISAIVRAARRAKIPLTARGGGYGYVGSCVPNRGGIVLSLERLSRIKEISSGDFVAVVEPGVYTQTLQEAVERKGLFYPPDPASRADCTIGGNVATNAGGPRCLKYGVTRDYILGLEVVLSDGTAVRLGGRTHKNKVGFDLARIFVGSEGLLGIVTEITLKLLPLPPAGAALSAGFRTMRDASRAIQSIFAAGLLPAALEIADGFTLAAVRRKFGEKILPGAQAHLLVGLDGQKNSVWHELSDLEKIVGAHQPLFLESANSPAECEKLWQLRREFSFALRDTGLMKLNEDIVVPRSRLQDLFAFTARLQRRHRIPIACFGHAGDGNIHVNLMVDRSRPGEIERTDAILDELFQQVVSWEGAITGEHGIGLAKKPWWPLAAAKPVRELHKRIKRALDPAGILNPGKFL